MYLARLSRTVRTLLLASAGLSAGACNSTPPTSTIGSQSAAIIYDGETVYRGVFLQQGPLAPVLAGVFGDDEPSPPLPNTQQEAAQQAFQAANDLDADGHPGEANSVRQMAQVIQDTEVAPDGIPDEDHAGDLLVAKVAQLDPTFMVRFGNKMQSGDPVQVKGAMDEASDLTLRASGLSAGDYGSHAQLAGVWLFIRLAVAINVAGAINIAAAVHKVVAVWKYWFWGIAQPNGGLTQDQVVLDLTQRLSP